MRSANNVSRSPRSVTLLIPTLNEIRGLKAIMPRINRDWVDQILFVDGNSVDGTIDWIQQHDYELVLQTRPGIRGAYQDAFPLIRGDLVITFSPDGNSVPELIPKLVEKLSQGFDMVVVSRYLEDAKSLDDDALSSFGNWLFTKTINVFYGAKYTDAMGIYRGYRTQLLADLGLLDDRWYRSLERILGISGLGCEPLISTRVARAALRIGEVQGDEPGRIDGQSRVFPTLYIKVKWAIAYYLQILLDRFRWHEGRRRGTK
ncbi:MAG: histidinol phosphate phosphatase [Dehalococcoidia bacterium]|nr:histidinol phosphate phosphatase [Dehalococcoidia bacterium]|tara:strand:+ start:13383 stop:14162 length:780 start_codon:yes stop_codon:yes gene_type:complete